jgi:hypothetical protein
MSPDTSGKFVYPLISMIPTNKSQVKGWWSLQDIKLDVRELDGNCLWCWKKSDRKLYTIYQENPRHFEFPRMLEKRFSFSGRPQYRELFILDDNGEPQHHSWSDIQIPRKMFRKNRTTSGIIASSNDHFDRFIERRYEFQLGLDLGNQEPEDFDFEYDCGASCESG